MPPTDDILIVDDSHESLLLLANILKQAGYNVRPADSGELALASVKAKAPALILLDVLMPYPDGFEVCRQLKARPSSCSIPVIFITSLNDVAERVQGLNIGGVDFISKPFQREELLSRVHTHLLLSKLQAGLEQQVAERTEQLQQANQQLQNELNERLLAEAALRESESRFFSAFMYAPVGKALVSSEGAFLKVNPALCQLLGYTEEELLSRTFQEITHPDDLETDLAYVHQMLAGEITTYQMQKRYFRKDGNCWISRVPVGVHCGQSRKIYDSFGEATGINADCACNWPGASLGKFSIGPYSGWFVRFAGLDELCPWLFHESHGKPYRCTDRAFQNLRWGAFSVGRPVGGYLCNYNILYCQDHDMVQNRNNYTGSSGFQRQTVQVSIFFAMWFKPFWSLGLLDQVFGISTGGGCHQRRSYCFCVHKIV